MTKNFILLVIVVSAWLFVDAQELTSKELIGQWTYQYSQDSLDGEWHEYVSRDLELVLNNDNAVLLDSEEMDEQFFEETAAMPLLLKDPLLEMKIFPAINEAGVVRFSFLQMPAADETFKYIDHAKGDLKGTIVVGEAKSFLKLTNLGLEGDYRILTINKTEMLLLDIENNTKHLFKRKQ